MNLNTFLIAIYQKWLKKTFMVMKLTTLILLITLIECSASSYGQKVNLKESRTSLEQVLTKIGKQTGYGIFYDSKDVDNKTVSIDLQNASLNEALNVCLQNSYLTYKIVGKNVILQEKNLDESTIQTKVPITVSGQVVDDKNSPLSGVTVKIKGTAKGTITDNNGKFRIEVADNSTVLTFSFVGFITKDVTATNSTISVQLLPDVSALDEVVVNVGYNTQKKVNLSGSVATVSGAQLAENPSPTFTNLLEGRVAGLTVVQPTGEPGLDAGSLQIRGLGSYGSSSTPLILVDGIVSSISNISPQDVASVTVLKDASSAAIYGSRAANGVILITTKKGKIGTSQIEYNNSFGTTSATVLPKFITNSATYMQMYNAANERSGQADQYTQAQINAYANGNGSAQYPNFDWMKYIFKNAPLMSHNLIASGANNLSDYYISVGYQNQKGIASIYDYDRYNADINYNVKINKRITAGTIANFSYQNITAPIFTNDNLILLAYAQSPTYGPYLPDGSGRRANRDYASNGSVNRTVDEASNEGFQTTGNYIANLQGHIDVNIIKGLDWRTKGAVNYFDQSFKNRAYPTQDPSYAYQPDASGNYIATGNGNPPFSGLQEVYTRTTTLTVNSILDYVKTFGIKHNFEALAGYEQISSSTSNLSGTRFNFPSSSINELNGGPTDGLQNSGTTVQYALRSGFGRATYNYAGKYFLEGNIRYDGTSRVDAMYRYGTFGGGSAAWRLSEESFIKNNITWINDLKLRGSYGILGNQEIMINGQLANYPYQQILSYVAYPFSNSLSTGVVLPALTTQNLKWETTTTTDLGVDFTLFKGLLGGTVDWYHKNTTGILAQQSDIPASVGLSAPVVNAGAMVNNGFEIALNHQNHIGNVTYGVNFILSKNNNKVTQVLGPNPGVFQVGLPYNSYYLYQFDGIFQSQAQINSSPAQPNSGNLKPGDIKIKDVNGDGKITPDDRVSYSPYPAYTYSFGFNVGWNGFNLSSFFQGVEGQKFFVNGWGIDPFFQGTSPTTDFLNAWTPTNPSNTIPAVYKNGYPGVTGYNSTYYLRDASYLRLKTLNLSYTFKRQLINVNWLKGLTVFAAANNLITWTKYKGEDPERATPGPNGARYAQFPQLKILSAGLKITL